ncbi:MAG: cytochrome b/b6 domain-containing protein, partial [Rhodospirillales bacterium]|nr:cytochrome b/b6 domain-containing protein [Rhodospirillales bacterium]
ELHEVGGWAILVLVGLHVAAALYHHVLCRDDVLASMLWQGLRRPDA